MASQPDTLDFGTSTAATPSQPVVRTLRTAASRDEPAPAPDMVALMEAIGPALDEPHQEASALALATSVAWHLGLDRVSFGEWVSARPRVLAVSDAPDRATHAAFTRLLETAMLETVRRGEPVQFTGTAGDLEAHRNFAAHGGAGFVYSVPIRHRGEICAVMVCEQVSRQPFSPAVLRACDALAALLGPILAAKRRERASIALRWFTQRRRLMILAAVLALVAALAAVKIDYRVSAPARVEGSVQRALVAPFDGYVETAPLRAGARVSKGQELATLQRSALDLERGSAAAARDELGKEYRRALASRDRAEARVLEARMAQAQARLDLLDAQISRTRITAPFDGVVLSGDLSRSLGAPVERGQVLFQVTPGEGFRIVLQVDERDVGDLAPGLTGTLTLAALPDRTFSITVTRVSGAARTEAGKSVFLVESRVDGGEADAAAVLRPGMEGVAKVVVEPRSLVWVVTHPLVEWVQLTTWSLLP